MANPQDLTISPVEAGASRSTSVYDFTVSGSNAIFEFNFDHLRDGDGPTGGKNYGDYAKSYGYIDFTTFIPLSYMIEGCYSMHGSNGLYISAALGSNGSMLFRNMQYSPYTTNESFTLGNAEGSGSNSLYGTLTGTLLPGKHYLSYDYFLPTMSTDPGATAVGTLRLTLTPEPATLTLLGIGLTLLPRRRGLHSLELSSR